jgi:hypothetical protein
MFRKTLSFAQLCGSFRLKLEGTVLFGTTRDKTAATFANPRIICLTGKEAGEDFLEDKLPPNRGFTLHFGIAESITKSGLIFPTPLLTAAPIIISQPAPLIYGGEMQPLSLTIQTLKQVHLEDFIDKPLAYLIQLD